MHNRKTIDENLDNMLKYADDNGSSHTYLTNFIKHIKPFVPNETPETRLQYVKPLQKLVRLVYKIKFTDQPDYYQVQ